MEAPGVLQSGTGWTSLDRDRTAGSTWLTLYLLNAEPRSRVSRGMIYMFPHSFKKIKTGQDVGSWSMTSLVCVRS